MCIRDSSYVAWRLATGFSRLGADLVVELRGDVAEVGHGPHRGPRQLAVTALRWPVPCGWRPRRPAGPSRSRPARTGSPTPVSYTHLRAHETRHDLVCRLLLE